MDVRELATRVDELNSVSEKMRAEDVAQRAVELLRMYLKEHEDLEDIPQLGALEQRVDELHNLVMEEQ